VLKIVLVGLAGAAGTLCRFWVSEAARRREGRPAWAAANVLASNLLGLLMVWAGHGLARLSFPAA
jgi:fluoride ion exporter CrcB/FEX